MKIRIIFIALLLTVSAKAQTLHTTLWNGKLLPEIKAQLKQGNTVYTLSYQKLIGEAQGWLQKPDPTIINKPMVPPSGDKHDYMSIGRYWWPNPNTADGLPYVRRDGKTNPEIEKYDRKPMAELVDGVTKLTLAYYYSDNKTYADKAVSLLKTWYLNPETRQNPNMNFAQSVPGVTNGEGRSEGVIDASGFIFVTDAIELLTDMGQLDAAETQALRNWFKQFCSWLVTSPLAIKERQAANNHSMAYDVQLARYAIFAGDHPTANQIFADYLQKRLIPQIEADGRMPLELARVTSFHYSVANIGEIMNMCDLAASQGVNLFTEGSQKGSIGMAIAFLIPYIDDQKAFPVKDETLNWKAEANRLVGLIYRASFYSKENMEKFREIYRTHLSAEDLFVLTYLRP